MCVLTDENDDQRWVRDNAGNVLVGRVAKEVYDHFTDGAHKTPG